MQSINFFSLNEAICYWLGYQFNIGRKRLLHEASLRYPIADALTGEGIEINRIALEKGHPYFNDRYVDILVSNEDLNKVEKEDFIDALNSLIELKICKAETGRQYSNEHQRIVDDILRLAYFNLISKKDSYFIICGQYKDFKNYFIGQKDEKTKNDNNDIQLKERQGNQADQDRNDTSLGWNVDKSLYSSFFDFEVQHFPVVNKEDKSKTYTLKLNTIPEDTDEKEKKKSEHGFNSFQLNYKPKAEHLQFESEIIIKTTCMAITPFELNPSRTHACGIWKIEAIIE